ncbi:2-oxoacid:acceptor oxidoreductase family protein [Ruminiclostridium josui]|uniref:2-oxoacid:acceptor oxidoreductase family protein n=1 Tax=Ruminiclostridium josui TaxID=1499 RepID=UPI0006D039CE|nr:2-oxoacid:acceptor oxidoreductase family protein [Ruminiclostridium josui]
MKQLELIIAGFGGQGILSAGRLLAYAGMLEGKNVSWLPSYGPEMRGGTANCSVVISDEPVGSPILDTANVLIVMNGPSLEKFEKSVVSGGLIISDSSLVEAKPVRTDIDFVGIPATQMASDMGNLTYANIIILGKLLAKTEIVSKKSFEAALKKVLPPKKHYMIPDEMKALIWDMIIKGKIHN